MLQLSGTLRNSSVRLTPISCWRVPAQQLIAACSGAANPSPLLTRVKEEEPSMRKSKKNHIKDSLQSRNPMIQAAFDTLRVSKFGPHDLRNEETMITSQMRSTANVKGLLKMVEGKKITHDNAFAMVTLLIDWVNNGKAKLSDFELDDRFLHLCELLSQPSKKGNVEKKNEKTDRYLDELNLFYGINEIDEATKEVANITVKQMIKVMSALAHQKRRTTPLLRSLSFNISRSHELLNVKQLSDLLYSMAILNYPDEVLLQKVSDDLMDCVSEIEKSPIIGSILTSLGILRYKNEELIDKLSEWTINNSEKLRPQDLCSFFLTLAMLGYTPTNVEALKKVLIEPLNESDMTKPAEWLDIVWAFTVLQLAENRHIASVLDSNFIQKLADSFEIPLPKKQKFLNINGAAQLLTTNYKGPLLDSDSEIFAGSIQRSKDKQIFMRSVIGALENIFPPPQYIKTNIDIGMGFPLDAEFCIDNEGNRLPVENKLKPNEGLRIAVMPLCYNDFCRGKQDRLGFFDLYCRILETKGYKILSIPHTEFSTEDKIIERTAYVNRRIKNIAK